MKYMNLLLYILPKFISERTYLANDHEISCYSQTCNEVDVSGGKKKEKAIQTLLFEGSAK